MVFVDTDYYLLTLKEWKEVQQKIIPDCNFVLSYGGIPTSKHTLPRALEKLAELAGVHRIKIHALRHPYVKPTTKKFASFLKFFRAAVIAARSCSIRYSWLIPPSQISPILKSLA